MRIINDDRTVLMHYGVKGMRWGVRKEREAANRSKAQGIVRNYKNSRSINKRDLEDAQWMSFNVGEKLARAVVIGTVPQIFRACMQRRAPTTAAELKKALTKVATTAAIATMRNEISSRGTLKRYTSEGKKDTSKRHYKRNSITPNRLVANLAATGVKVAPTLFKVGKMTYKAAQANRAETERKVRENMRVIYDDGYMSVLEKVKP